MSKEKLWIDNSRKNLDIFIMKRRLYNENFSKTERYSTLPLAGMKYDNRICNYWDKFMGKGWSAKHKLREKYGFKIREKRILNKISELDRKNKELFDKKAKLENEILIIDIKIFKVSREYDELVKKLLKN